MLAPFLLRGLANSGGKRMRQLFLVAILILFVSSPPVFAKSVNVRGGVTKSGTYRAPHQRTSPNKTKVDNWSTKGNVNPNTGKAGTVDPYKMKSK